MQDNNKGKGLSTGAIVLISIVGALALALIIIIAGLMIMSSLNNGDEDEPIVSDETDLPSRDDIYPYLLEYLNDIDDEKKQSIIDEAVKRDYPINWPMLWIVVKRVNADSFDEEGRAFRFDVTMTDEEADYHMNEMPQLFKERISEYTNGLVNVDIKTILYDEVNFVDEEYCRLRPESFPDLIDSFEDYNTVLVTSRLQTYNGDSLKIGWGGVADWYMPKGNYQFAQVQTSTEPGYEKPSRYALFEGNPVPEETYIHEWLHTFEEFEIQMQDCDANPDEAQKHGYECLTTFGANGFYEYYKDMLNQKVWDKEKQKYVGMNEQLWRTYSMLMDISKNRFNDNTGK